jgi:3-deoxy-D-manno-octulosonic-acid transferase
VPYLLNLVYLTLMAILSPWLIYSAIKKGKYREGFAEKWLGQVPIRGGDRQCAWLHAVSVGEVNLLARLLADLEKQHRQWEFVISTTSTAGYALAKKKYPSHTVFYCPLDFTWAVNSAFKRLRPSLLILAELELWPNMVWAAQRAGVPVVVINGRLSEKSFRGYSKLGWLMKSMLGSIDVVAAQNETYAQRFTALGAPQVHVTGSLKFDGAETNRHHPRTQRLAHLAGIEPDDIVFLAGSTQAPEEELALATYLQLREEYSNLRLIVVPRHPERFAEVAALLDRSGITWQRRSKLENRPADPAARVLLVDVVGELGAWWGTAAIGFVGGSLLNRRGGQNMIEPAAYGTAICYGPNTWNFRDIVALMHERDAACVVRSGEELTAFVRRCLADPAVAAALGENAQRLVHDQLGATARTIELLAPYIDEPATVLFTRAA